MKAFAPIERLRGFRAEAGVQGRAGHPGRQARHGRQCLATVGWCLSAGRDGSGYRAEGRAAGPWRLSRFSGRGLSSRTKWASARSSPSPSFSIARASNIDDIGLFEINEAFASQAIYCQQKLGIDPDKLNVNGGGIAIGHPFGMTGSSPGWPCVDRGQAPGRQICRHVDVRCGRYGRCGAVRGRLMLHPLPPTIPHAAAAAAARWGDCPCPA